MDRLIKPQTQIGIILWQTIHFFQKPSFLVWQVIDLVFIIPG